MFKLSSNKSLIEALVLSLPCDAIVLVFNSRLMFALLLYWLLLVSSFDSTISDLNFYLGKLNICTLPVAI